MMCILINSFNRPDYLKRCLGSLEETYLPDDAIVYIIDDCSGNGQWLVRYTKSMAGKGFKIGKGLEVLYDKKKAQALISSGDVKFVRSHDSGMGADIREIINNFNPSCDVKVYYKDKNLGVYDSLLIGHKWAFDNGYDYVITLADDIVVNNLFYSYMTYYKSIFPDNIISGFNTLTTSENGKPRHPVYRDGVWYASKKSSGSACIGIDERLYNKYVKPAILERMDKQRWYDTLATANAYKGGNGVICTVPSVAQHIGLGSKMGHDFNPDVAFDFKMKYINTINKRKTLSVNIATYPPRAKYLKRVIDALLKYEVVDKIRVYLNEYKSIPKYLKHPKIETHIGENLKDSGKFFWANIIRDEYYFTLDDDLLPTEAFFINHLALLDKYNGVVVVSSHGKVLKPSPIDFRDFYESYACRNTIIGDHWINFPGTGVMVFDNSRYVVPAFDTHGMADLHIAKYCQINRIPCIVRGHEAAELELIYNGKETLWDIGDSMKKEHLDILNSIKEWILLIIKG